MTPLEALEKLGSMALYEVTEFEHIRHFKDIYQTVKKALIEDQSTYKINRHEFIKHVEAVESYHSDDWEFCENYRESVQELIKDNLK